MTFMATLWDKEHRIIQTDIMEEEKWNIWRMLIFGSYWIVIRS